MAETKVIDISKFQGSVDFAKVKADGVQGVIIRCGYTGYGKAKTKNTDSRWESNYRAATAAGLPVGAYYYSCAVTPAEARSEAEYVLGLIRGKTFDYPVYWDTEDSHDTGLYAPESQLSIGRARLTEVGKAFLETLKNAGVYTGLYASTSWLNNQLDMSKLSEYDVWVAQYASSVTYRGEYQMWQYTSTGRVSGIGTAVDLNRCYVDYPSIIRGRGGEIMKRGDRSQSVLGLKMLLASARALGIITQGVDDNSIFGEGTYTAVLQLQAAAGLPQTGEAGDAELLAAKNLISQKADELNGKISRALEVLS